MIPFISIKHLKIILKSKGMTFVHVIPLGEKARRMHYFYIKGN